MSDESPNKAAEQPSNQATKPATTIGSWALSILQALNSYGFDGDEICQQYAIDTARLNDPNYRIPVVTMTQLWRKSVALTGDSAFGLRVAEHVTPTTFHALGFASLVSRNFEDVAKLMTENSDVITEVGKVRLLAKDQQIWFCMDVKSDSPDVADEAMDAFMASVVHMGRQFVGKQNPLIEVHLQRQKPLHGDAFPAFFEVPVIFGSDVNALVAPMATALSLMPGYNPALVEANQKVLRDYKNAQFQSLSTQITEIIEELLPDEPLQTLVAARLNMSVRKMQRHLKAEKLSYQSLLDDYRKTKSLALLNEGRVNLKVIAHRLGFANQSAFTRAFKRWTGQTPNQIIKNQLR